MPAYYSYFRYLGLESENGDIVARISEKEKGLFSKTNVYKWGEARVYSFFKNFDSDDAGWADDESRQALIRAYDAIRGIPFDITVDQRLY